MKTYTHNWHVRVRKLKAPFKFAATEYGYWNRIKTKRILKRCDCKLVNMPRAKRNLINEKAHIGLWTY